MSARRLRTAGVADTAECSLTIEQLAAESGMTVRNIRAHRARGLLPAPEVRERVGYYGPDHLARLKLIQQLQADGFNLRAIQRLLEQTGSRPEQLLTVREALREPFQTEPPAVVTLQELRERFGEQADERTLQRAQRSGLLVPLGEERFEVPMPSLLDVAEEALRRGLPLAHAVTLFSRLLRQHCRTIARDFVHLFLDDVWKPFADASYPEERWAEMTESIEQLRPLSSRALLAAHQLTMAREVEKAFGRELERITRKRRPAGGG